MPNFQSLSPPSHPDEFGPDLQDALADYDWYCSVEHAKGGSAVVLIHGKLFQFPLRRKAEVGEVPKVEPPGARGSQALQFSPTPAS